VQKFLGQVSTKENLEHELIEIGEEVGYVRPRRSGLPLAAGRNARQTLEALTVKFEPAPRIDEAVSGSGSHAADIVAKCAGHGIR